jgi:hypothetical protein
MAVSTFMTTISIKPSQELSIFEKETKLVMVSKIQIFMFVLISLEFCAGAFIIFYA